MRFFSRTGAEIVILTVRLTVGARPHCKPRRSDNVGSKDCVLLGETGVASFPLHPRQVRAEHCTARSVPTSRTSSELFFDEQP